MPCYRPLKGWYSRDRTEKGKRKVVFTLKEGYVDRPVVVPCGVCIGCRLDRARQWAMRILHESQMYEDNCFVTLTYDEKNVGDGQLKVRDFQLFMKKLRKRIKPEKIRFFHCGEYGEKFSRPHYHVIFFGIDFRNIGDITQEKKGLTECKFLEEIWEKGFVMVGDCTFESAAYVAGYVTKKVAGKEKEGHYKGMKEEYVTMSRRPGIGYKWYEKYGKEIYPYDEVVIKGKTMKPPKYYDGLLEVSDPEELKRVKLGRMYLTEVQKENTEELRLRERERVAVERWKFFNERRFEHE